MVIAAPADEYEINQALTMAVESDKPFVIRYPRDTVPVVAENTSPYEFGKSAMMRQGDSEFVIVTIGSVLREAIEAADILKQEGLSITVVNGRFVKPVDPALFDYFKTGKTVIIAEDNSIAGGFGSAIIEQALNTAKVQKDRALNNSIGKAVLLGAPDASIPPAKRDRQLEWMGLTAEKLVETIKTLNFQTENVDI
jgi:1-deoxy-D-xylulose-5-phosphate synthase